jgi:hypothetical protein
MLIASIKQSEKVMVPINKYRGNAESLLSQCIVPPNERQEKSEKMI